MASTEGAPKQDFSSWRYTIRVMGALFIPIFLETLDYTGVFISISATFLPDSLSTLPVVATAQTNIASKFNRLDLQSYIGTAYVLTSTVFLPIFASFADVFGRHSAMQLSLVFFLVGSAISTGASEMIAMLVGRGVAGIGAAGLLTVSYRHRCRPIFSLDTFTDRILCTIGCSRDPRRLCFIECQ